MLLALVVLLVVALRPGPALAQTAKRPTVRDAPAAILVEQATGDVVFARQADKERPIASTTKLMTALLALERLSLDDVLVQVPYAAAPAESLGGFQGGERVTVRDDLRALLIVSANDAANTLAVRIGGTRPKFVALMNRRARELGLTHTHYANPIGLDDPGNYSSAADLVKLALILRQNAFFRATTDTEATTIRSGAKPRRLVNRNLVLGRLGAANGVKTGHTSGAGYVLVGSATRNGITVLSAVLGTPSEAARDADTVALLSYGLGRYHRVTALKQGTVLARAALRFRGGESVDLIADGTVRRTARANERLSTQVLGAPKVLDGPLAQGARVGTVVVRQRGRIVARVPLVTAREVKQATATDRLQDFGSRTHTIVALAVFVLGSLALIVVRRRIARRRRAAERARRREETEIAA